MVGVNSGTASQQSLTRLFQGQPVFSRVTVAILPVDSKHLEISCQRGKLRHRSICDVSQLVQILSNHRAVFVRVPVADQYPSRRCLGSAHDHFDSALLPADIRTVIEPQLRERDPKQIRRPSTVRPMKARELDQCSTVQSSRQRIRRHHRQFLGAELTHSEPVRDIDEMFHRSIVGTRNPSPPGPTPDRLPTRPAPRCGTIAAVPETAIITLTAWADTPTNRSSGSRRRPAHHPLLTPPHRPTTASSGASPRKPNGMNVSASPSTSIRPPRN
ncbi:Uncharacterised protein [Nocardia asteroides]|nr:hypothetical protein SAMN05444423_111144 [Nocardia asteroides]VEG34364.1 Uncharacterised protein [Nocardia asteroides]